MLLNVIITKAMTMAVSRLHFYISHICNRRKENFRRLLRMTYISIRIVENLRERNVRSSNVLYDSKMSYDSVNK